MKASRNRLGILDRVLIVLAVIWGGGSMLLFGAFLYRGSFDVLPLGLGGGALLAFDAFLCLIFFAQHSVMVRRGFRERLAHVADRAHHGVVYAIASGIALTVLVLGWQPSGVVLYTIEGGWAWGLRAVWLLALPFVGWAWLALRGFDPLGIAPLRERRRGRTTFMAPLVVRGPYRIVRHPLYAAFLALTWATPVLTTDRLLFNVLWTVWIVLGTVLEERDLVATLGDDYRAYQRHVPMLLPGLHLRFSTDPNRRSTDPHRRG